MVEGWGDRCVRGGWPERRFIPHSRYLYILYIPMPPIPYTPYTPIPLRTKETTVMIIHSTYVSTYVFIIDGSISYMVVYLPIGAHIISCVLNCTL